MAGENGVNVFTLEIDTANAAFEPDATATIAGMLRTAADVLEKRCAADVPAYLTLVDVNGNTCGAFYYRPICDGDACAVDGCGKPAAEERRVNGLCYALCVSHRAASDKGEI
jgi:hypothetical protein